MIEDYTAISNAPNSPELNGKYLGLISSDFVLVADTPKRQPTKLKNVDFLNSLFLFVRSDLLKLAKC